MNNNYNNAIFPGSPLYSENTQVPNQQSVPPYNYDLPMEQSYTAIWFLLMEIQ